MSGGTTEYTWELNFRQEKSLSSLLSSFLHYINLLCVSFSF